MGMQKFILIAAVLLMGFGSKVNAQSCCTQQGATWAALAMNTDFREAHLAPEPLAYEAPAKGSMIKFNTLDANAPGNAYYLPSDKPTDKVLILFHEWWGLNDYIKQEAENWQKLLGNVDVYAIDLYDGKVADSPSIAQKLSSGMDEKRGETLIKGLLSHIGNDKLIANLGWCFGGTWAFTAGRLAEKQSAGIVMYYGFPEKDEKKIATLKTDVLYVWASQDKFITKNLVDDFGKQVEASGHKFTMQTFDAVHAFANPSNPKHDMLATKQAEQIAKKFLTEKLQLQ
jgi:Dienelactone hydrolase and related enzymes